MAFFFRRPLFALIYNHSSFIFFILKKKIKSYFNIFFKIHFTFIYIQLIYREKKTLSFLLFSYKKIYFLLFFLSLFFFTLSDEPSKTSGYGKKNSQLLHVLLIKVLTIMLNYIELIRLRKISLRMNQIN